MRGASVGALGILILSACSGDVPGRIDAVSAAGRRYVHGEGLIRFDDRPGARSIAPRLRESPDGRGLLDAGQAAVPDLIRLLDDPARRTMAAVFLAEIGGERAVGELLRRWRSLRDDAREMQIVLPVKGGSVALGYRYEGVDDGFYGELIMALGYAGGPVSGEIAKDTDVALAESERLAAAGAELLFREGRDEDGRRIELRRYAGPIETAREGLRAKT